MTLWPEASILSLLVVGAVLIAAIAVVMDFGATVIDIQCSRSSEGVSCTMNESTFVTSSRNEHASADVTGFSYRSSGSEKNQKEWMTLDAKKGDTKIASTVPSAGRAEALERLNTFAHDASQRSVRATLGSRWDGLHLLPLFLPLLGFMYLLMGSRIKATVDRRHGQAQVQSQLWPLPPRAIDFKLDALAGFTAEAGGKGSTRIVVRLTDGTALPVTRTYTGSDKTALLAKLEQFVRGGG